jgi:hypothetical protein
VTIQDKKRLKNNRAKHGKPQRTADEGGFFMRENIEIERGKRGVQTDVVDKKKTHGIASARA